MHVHRHSSLGKPPPVPLPHPLPLHAHPVSSVRKPPPVPLNGKDTGKASKSVPSPSVSNQSNVKSIQEDSKSKREDESDESDESDETDESYETDKSDGRDESESGDSDKSEDDYATNAAARREAIKMMLTKAQGLDLCFLLDATSSMRPYITLVKDEVAGMAAAIKTTNPACSLRVACAIYRDYCDAEGRDDVGCDFTPDFNRVKSIFKKYLSSVRASGGGDEAEDIFTGLERVARLDWREANRLLVHIGDSPCHGTRFHNLSEGDDKYPKGDKFGRDIFNLLTELREKVKISHYFFCHLNDSTEKMLQEFKKVKCSIATCLGFDRPHRKSY